MDAWTDGMGGEPVWMAERRALLAQHARRAARARPGLGRIPLSLARAHVRESEARPEIMRAWASAPAGGRIPDDAWDLITAHNAYLWVRSGCSQDALDAVGDAVRRLALREFDGAESEALVAHLAADPRVLDDRG